MLLAVTLILVFMLLDFTLIGLLPSMFGIWPSLSDIKEEPLIEDSTIFGSIRTDMEGRFVSSMINKRVGYKSIVLTSTCLVVKNTRRTYLLKIDLKSIYNYTVMKQLVGKRIILHLLTENRQKFFQFRTCMPDTWIKAFLDMGLHRIEDNGERVS